MSKQIERNCLVVNYGRLFVSQREVYTIIILYEQMNDSLLVLFPWFNRSLEKGEKKKMIGDEQQIE
ncbi:hypothetical protein BLOT_013078 [Blomia tropicalis]|nr:hypothetical protein BLOT_013078 [Blomia tropicalis]